jgi:hypothetical protein
MLRRLVSPIVLLACAAAAHAAPDTPPAGWTLGGDGAYTHADTGTACAPAFGDLAFVRLDGPSGPNVLGVCVYAAGATKAGQIRIRKFIDGVGDTPLAIQNDRALMGLIPAPPGQTMEAAFRAGPGPQLDGATSRQTVITKLRNGLLIDCIIQEAHPSGPNGLDPLLKVCLSGQ